MNISVLKKLLEMGLRINFYDELLL